MGVRGTMGNVQNGINLEPGRVCCTYRHGRREAHKGYPVPIWCSVLEANSVGHVYRGPHGHAEQLRPCQATVVQPRQRCSRQAVAHRAVVK